MPKIPAVSGKMLVRVLEQMGFEQKRQRGSHVLLKHADGRRVTVPIHGNKDIPPGTLSAILFDGNISKEELREKL